MAGRFPDRFLDDLRARADIVQIVSRYVPLKQNGRRYWGLCPFHNEKTPSFSVDGERQLYYCFGCKAGGSVIQFVMEVEKLDFAEAVAFLADQLHMPLPDRKVDDGYEQRKRDRERLTELNRAAATFYHQQLWTEAGAEILRYFHARGVSDATIRRFGLGACAEGWDALTRHLLSQGYSLDDCRAAGVTVVKENRRYDMFRQRAMFPIIDQQGQVLGFGGRAMGDQQPKYLNTGDTPAFNKRLGVYAANLLRKARNIKRVVLVEGYMDVVSLMQAGMEGVVATLGTALTPEQARLLKRYAPEVWVAYDGDSAGQHAILRALDIFEAEGVPCRVLFFPDGQDPDEFVRASGLAGVEKLRPLDPVTYRLMRLRDEYDFTHEEERINFTVAAAKILAKVDEPVALDAQLNRLETQTGFSREVLLEQIRKSGVDLKAAPPARNKPTVWRGREAPANECERAQETLLLLAASGYPPVDGLSLDDFSDELYRDVIAALCSGQSATTVLEGVDDPADRARLSAIFSREAPKDAPQALQMQADCFNAMARYRVEEELAVLTGTVAQLTGQARTDAMARYQALTEELKRLKASRRA